MQPRIGCGEESGEGANDLDLGVRVPGGGVPRWPGIAFQCRDLRIADMKLWKLHRVVPGRDTGEKASVTRGDLGALTGREQIPAHAPEHSALSLEMVQAPGSSLQG